MTDAPEIGIYYDIPFEDYCAWPAMNQSRLKLALRSLKKYKYGPDFEPSEAMRMGNLIHTCQLEPGRLAERYAVMPRFETQVKTADGKTPDRPKLTKQYKDLVAEWKANNEDRETVTQDWMDTATGTVRALAEDANCREYLLEGRKEVSIVWLDAEIGYLCKARVDNWQRKRRRICDLKSTRDVYRFPWSMYDFGYHIQGAFYSDGMWTLTGDHHEFCIAAVETDQPHECGAAPVSRQALEQGRILYKSALHAIRQAEDSGAWPGFQSPDTWELPESKQQTVLKLKGAKVAI